LFIDGGRGLLSSARDARGFVTEISVYAPTAALEDLDMRIIPDLALAN